MKPLGTLEPGHNICKNFYFPNFGQHLEFCQKCNMSIMSKTVGDRVIWSRCWAHLGTLDPGNYAYDNLFSEF